MMHYLRVKGDDRIHVIRSKNGVHSEQRMKRWMELKGKDKSDLEEFFSERGPCTYGFGGGCQAMMTKTFPDAKGTYLFDYFDEASRAAASKAHGKYVRGIFKG